MKFAAFRSYGQGVLFAALSTVGSRAGAQDAAARAALPEFQVIPAARAEELTPAEETSNQPYFRWTRSQGDEGARRYSALAEINRGNVQALKVAWTYHSGDVADNVECTPIVVDGVMYGPTPTRSIVAVDAATGKEKWRYDLGEPKVIGLQNAPARRGLEYWPGDADNPPRILFGADDWIYAIDPKTGKLLDGFGDHGRTPIATSATAGCAVYQHVFVTTGLYGDVYGYDLVTGKNLWRFHTVARGTEIGANTWSHPMYGADAWSGLSVDTGRGIVYIATGNPDPTMVGTSRLGDDLFSDCLLALDATTGRYLWHFQTVRHDIWDLDAVGVPSLLTITVECRKVDVVTLGTKAGIVLLCDRVTGKPIFPFRLRKAPVSTIPGEVTAPYQPDPELPEQLSPMAFDPAEITNLTPSAHEAVVRQVARSTYGFYAPHVVGKPTLYTGSRGGAEWSGSAVDVPTGRVYYTSNRWVSKVIVIPNDERDRDPHFPPSSGEKIFMQYCAACHGPDRMGRGMAPTLVALRMRMKDADVLDLLAHGRGGMPPNNILTLDQKRDLIDFLFRRNQPPSRKATSKVLAGADYVFTGYNFLEDDRGYPGIQPPWGLLNCYDMNTGKVLWRTPLGEFGELTKEGVSTTGGQNLGGATVTAGGLVFVSGTKDEKIRAFDADSGKELWSAKLPFAGTAAPAVYETGGREYVVITATGGGRVGGASGPGDAYVAFALPR